MADEPLPLFDLPTPEQFPCRACGKPAGFYKSSGRPRRCRCKPCAAAQWNQNPTAQGCRVCGKPFGAKTNGKTTRCHACIAANHRYACPQCGKGKSALGTCRDCLRHAGDPCRETGVYTCKQCAKIFTPEPGQARFLFCSIHCCWNFHSGKPRRRARRFGVAYEHIDPNDVFERDAWRCQICGRKTPRAWRGTLRPQAPEIDHRTPLSRGGTHTWNNVQTACHACNVKKRDHKPVGQLSLLDKPQK